MAIDSSIKWGAQGFLCVSVTTVCIALIATSFVSVDDTEICLRYNMNTRVVEPEPYVDAGQHFVGVTDNFICYPKQLLSLEFSDTDESAGELLTVRSKEGLEIQLDLNIEYRIIAAELFELFQEVTTNYVPMYIRLARSELRNAAATFNATDYLGQQRGNVSLMMKNTLQQTFNDRHAEVIDVQLREIILPPSFDDAIRAVESAKLDAQAAVQERLVALAEEDQKNRTRVIELLAERQAILLEERTNVIEAKLDQEAQLVKANVDAQLALLQAETNRVNILLQAEADVERALAERNGKITAANANLAEASIQFETEILEARSAADITVLNANATAVANLLIARANVDAYTAQKEAELDTLVYIASSRDDMNATQLLRYRWLEVLEDMKDTLFTVDYEKTPFFLESGYTPPANNYNGEGYD